MAFRDLGFQVSHSLGVLMALGHYTVRLLYKEVKPYRVNSCLKTFLRISELQGLLCSQRRASDELGTVCSQLACLVCLGSVFYPACA